MVNGWPSGEGMGIHHRRGTFIYNQVDKMIPSFDTGHPGRGKMGTWIELLVAKIEAMTEPNR